MAEFKDSSGRLGYFARFEAFHSHSDPKRSYLLVNEAGLQYDWSDTFTLTAGKSLKFWGALEAYNITDTFNTKNFLFSPYSPFDKSKKYGSWNIASTARFENGELELIVKAREEEQPLPSFNSAENPLPLPYDPSLIYPGNRQGSFYARYSANRDNLDYAFILERGYDNQRALTYNGRSLQQTLSLCTKFAGYATLVDGNNVYKAEAAYTDSTIENYYHLGIGAEHTFYSLIAQSDATLYLEYYRSDTDSILQLFQNDWFGGIRLNFNDTDSSELKAGVIYDPRYGDRIIEAQFKRRLAEGWSGEFRLRRIDTDSIASPLYGDDKSLTLRAMLAYYF